jgi:flagellar hook-associated protein 3 FlgL
MRVNPNIVPDILSALSQSKQQEQTALLQMSSGKRVNLPSDDPIAAAAEVQNQASSARVDQYTQNITTVQSMMQVADSALSSIVTQLTAAVTAGTEGATGTTNDANRQTLAEQVQGILKTVVSQANVSFHGVYLFAGTATTTVPFDADPSSATYLAYNGNEGVNSVGVGDGLNVNTNVPGDQLFSTVLTSLQTLADKLQSGTQDEIKTATTDVNTALTDLSQQRVFYGNSSSMLSSQQTFLQQETTNLASQENTLVGVDMATAITSFAQAQIVNQAALSAAGKALQQTLMDYLK